MKHTRETVKTYIAECREKDKVINLSGKDLSGLDLSNLDLRSANLSSTDLSSTDLRSANLSSADMRYADLSSTDLRCANLSYANLSSADLRSADLDFAGFTLSCKTIGIKASRRLVSQLLYHLCRMDVSDCPEWGELRNDDRLIALANQSHVIGVHGMPGIEKTSKGDTECLTSCN